MASLYPGALDDFTNPTATDSLNDPTVPHATQHADANDAIEAIQATLGIDPQGTEATVDARIGALETTIDTASTGLVDRVGDLETTVDTTTTGLVDRVDVLETSIVSYYGQVGKQTQSTITIGTAGAYQSTGITATLDTLANSGISLGTTDTFAVKNTSGETRVFQITASMDCLTAADAAIGIKLALNGTPIDDSDCRAWAVEDYTAKLVTTWLVELDDDDEVALFVANHTDTANVTFIRGRVVATTVN
jgi:hypothetical protein